LNLRAAATDRVTKLPATNYGRAPLIKPVPPEARTACAIAFFWRFVRRRIHGARDV